jgi:hypothetical protein
MRAACLRLAPALRMEPRRGSGTVHLLTRAGAGTVRSRNFLHERAIQQSEYSMSNKVTQHVVPHDEGWAVRRGGADRATEVFDTQQEAIERAREISQNQGAELFIHGTDGRIRERNSYGNDPFPPRG